MNDKNVTVPVFVWGAEFARPENDGPKIFNNWKMQDPENDGPGARCMLRIRQTGVLF